MYSTLDEWILHEDIRFSVDSSETFKGSIDRAMVSLGDSVELIGFGEGLHSGEDILMLRNRILLFFVLLGKTALLRRA